MKSGMCEQRLNKDYELLPETSEMFIFGQIQQSNGTYPLQERVKSSPDTHHPSKSYATD